MSVTLPNPPTQRPLVQKNGLIDRQWQKWVEILILRVGGTIALSNKSSRSGWGSFRMPVAVKALIDAGYAASSLTTVYTATQKVIIDKFTATNVTGAGRTLDVHLIPSGGSGGDSNKIIDALSVGANSVESVTELERQILEAGDAIAVNADGASAIVIRASGREVT